MEAIQNSEALVGYTVRIMHREAFKVTGYTLIVPPRSGKMTPRFWDEVSADGRLAKLMIASSVKPWILGLGSWDPECEKLGQRYTICIEETRQTDFAALAREHILFTKDIGASTWMCFALAPGKPERNFWKDNPYKMMKVLGYDFNDADYSVGLHFDVYPPQSELVTSPAAEFWITVKKG